MIPSATHCREETLLVNQDGWQGAPSCPLHLDLAATGAIGLVYLNDERNMYNAQDAFRWPVFIFLIYERGTVRHPILNCQVCSEHHSHVVWTKRWHLRLVGREPIACKLQRPNLLCASLGAAELCSSFVKVLWSRNATRSHPRFDPHGMISSPRQLPDESTIPSSVWNK